MNTPARLISALLCACASLAAQSPGTPGGDPGFGPILLDSTDPKALPPGVGAEMTGTGETTGTIAKLRVTNLSVRPVLVNIEPSYVPAGESHQGYVIPEPVRVVIGPGRENEIPIRGFCTDVGLDPVPEGEPMPPVFHGTDGRPSFGGPGDGAAAPGDQDAGAADAGGGVFGDPGAPRDFPETRRPLPIPTFPFLTPLGDPSASPAEAPLTGPFEPDRRDIKGPVNFKGDPALLAQLLIPINQAIIEAYGRVKARGEIVNPIPMSEEEERDAFIQQTFWLATGAMREDEPYTVEKLEARLTEQIEEKTGRPIEEMPPATREKVEEGADDIFESLVLVGKEAKVLREKSAGGRSVPTEPPPERECVRGITVPPITHWDLYGDLFRNGHLQTDPAVFRARLRLAIARAEGLLQSINGTLDAYAECNGPCDQNDRLPADGGFPPFPGNFNTVIDLCDEANADKDRLSDFDDGLNNYKALDAWFAAYADAMNRLGAGPNGPTLGDLERAVEDDLDSVAGCVDAFNARFAAWAELSLNRNEKWAEVMDMMSKGFNMALGFAMGGPVGAVVALGTDLAGDAATAGLEAAGWDEGSARLAGSLVSLSAGVGGAGKLVAKGLADEIGEEAFKKAMASTLADRLGTSVMKTGLKGTAAGARELAEMDAEAARERLQSFVRQNMEGARKTAQKVLAGLSLACDESWEHTKQMLKDAGYGEYGIGRLENLDTTSFATEEYPEGRHLPSRQGVKDCVADAMNALCRKRDRIRAALPAMREALEAAEAMLDPARLQRAFNDAVLATDCCCEYRDGSSDAPCLITVP